MGFDFTATARCEVCGNYMSSPDSCNEHSTDDVKKHVFRHMKNDTEMKKIHATPEYKWQRLYDLFPYTWMQFEYIGSQEIVDQYKRHGFNFQEIPMLQVCTHASELDFPDIED
jgi:hypothetical protein